MVRNNKLKQHLKTQLKNEKRLNGIKLYHRGSISQRVKKRCSNIDPVFENEIIKSENIEQYHLDKVLN